MDEEPIEVPTDKDILCSVPRRGDEPPMIPGGEFGTCTACLCEVHLAPTTLAFMKEKEFTILCLPCVEARQSLIDNADGVYTAPGAAQEAAEYYKNKWRK